MLIAKPSKSGLIYLDRIQLRQNGTSVLIAAVHEGVGLFRGGDTGFVSLSLDCVLRLAATICDLGSQRTITRLNAVDDLLCGHAHLVADTLNQALNVAQGRL